MVENAENYLSVIYMVARFAPAVKSIKQAAGFAWLCLYHQFSQIIMVYLLIFTRVASLESGQLYAREKILMGRGEKNIAHDIDVKMGALASQITSASIVYSTFVQTQIKENIKATRHWPLWGELIGYRWIPRTKGQ